LLFPDKKKNIDAWSWSWVLMNVGIAYLGEGTVVPEVTLVGEAVADKAKLALLDVLLDRVKELLLGDL
jgi:hypothetical protein